MEREWALVICKICQMVSITKYAFVCGLKKKTEQKSNQK